MEKATLDFLCGECDGHTTFVQDIHLGDNTADFTCTGCGEQWHVLFEVTSLDPLHIGTSLIKCAIGVMIGGKFYGKEQLQ